MSKKRGNKQPKKRVRNPLQRMDARIKQSDIIKKRREEAARLFGEAVKSGTREKVLEYARQLAAESRELDPHVVKVIWFPHDYEVRLIELDENTMESFSRCVEPFYFDATAEVPVPSGVAVIRPDEYGKLTMPDDWGTWADGQELEIGMKP